MAYQKPCMRAFIQEFTTINDVDPNNNELNCKLIIYMIDNMRDKAIKSDREKYDFATHYLNYKKIYAMDERSQDPRRLQRCANAFIQELEKYPDVTLFDPECSKFDAIVVICIRYLLWNVQPIPPNCSRLIPQCREMFDDAHKLFPEARYIREWL